MNFEVLKKNKLKKNILIGAMVVLILSAIVLTFTRAKYRVTESVPLVSGTINFSPYDFNLIAMYLNQDGAMPAGQTKGVPKFGYTLDTEQSTCIVDDAEDERITMNYVSQTADEKAYITFDKMSQSGTKCTVYFDLIPDSENPVINQFVASSSDDTSITVTVDASDNIGIYYYYFKLDNGEEIRSEESSYIFDGLVKGSVHTVTVRVEDAAGNEASDSSDIKVGFVSPKDLILAVSKPDGEILDWTGQITYYYTGKPNNWVKFGKNSSNQDLYWRIIRINGDKTIRMIYQGTGFNETGVNTQIQTSAFNILGNNNNMYVGYMYGNSSSNYNSTHANINSSTIKKVLDSWYQENLTEETEYIDGNAGFCGDRTPSTNSGTSNGYGGTGTTTTYYGPYIRLDINKNPNLQCPNDADIYTTEGSSTGNEALTYPIGLISADEAVLAGLVNNNQNNYLFTNTNYWTMSPYRFDGFAQVFRVVSSGQVAWETVTVEMGALGAYGVRPVINLRSDVSLTGTGTTSDPFKVVGAS